MAITIIYHPCYKAADLILCSGGKALLDLSVFPICGHLRLLFYFFDLAANCYQLLFKFPAMVCVHNSIKMSHLRRP